MYTKNELMFPHYAIPRLREARGESWRELIDRLTALPETHEDILAFMLVMIRLNGCMACETDSYRAMRGCTMCTLQTLRRFKGSDADLLDLFEQARGDVRQYLEQPNSIEILANLVEIA
ncbi:MAG: hypothetical protein GXY36_13020 [Chloroflexi bacterium]|nr:hypothetical protein [Chloroflexota bacterium]